MRSPAAERNNIEELQKFWDEFDPLVQNAYDNMEKKELERTGELCPECGSELVYRNGRYGKFISCINFPEVPLYKERGRTAGER